MTRAPTNGTAELRRVGRLSVVAYRLSVVAAFLGFALSTAPSRAAEDEGTDDQRAKADEKAKPADNETKPADDAAEKKKPEKEEKEAGEEDVYGHGMQFGLRAGIVLGYKIDFRYQHSPLCAPYDPTKGSWDQQQKICGFGAPPAADVALSFAPLDSVEPFIFGRFGFSAEAATATTAQFLFGAGVRLYTMSDSRFKMFVEPAIAYEGDGAAGMPGDDHNPPGLNPEYKQDLVFHLGIGPQYDFAKAFGAFINGGVDVGVLRSISANLLLNIGVQLRAP